MRLSRYLGMWGTRGVGSQLSYTPMEPKPLILPGFQDIYF